MLVLISHIYIPSKNLRSTLLKFKLSKKSYTYLKLGVVEGFGGSVVLKCIIFWTQNVVLYCGNVVNSARSKTITERP